VRLRHPVNGRRNFTGIVRAVEGERVEFDYDSGRLAFDLAELERARAGAQAMMPEGYMSRELLLQADALAREKNVHKDVVFGALEMAIASATKKKFTEDVDVRVAIDRNTGDFESFRRWQVGVRRTGGESVAGRSLFSEAQKQYPDIQLGIISRRLWSRSIFGRIGAQPQNR